MSPTAETEGWAYLEAMFHLNKIISEKLNPDAIASATYAEILDNCEAVENIRNKLKVRLRSKETCKSAVDRLQHFAIRLHTSFIISVCCRPALLRRDSNLLDAEQKKFLADRCKANLTETVRMFLAMHQLSVIPTRSWAFTYHGLSSAVLLGILGETKADPEVRQLQGDLISALSATAAKDLTSPRPHIRKTDLDIELSGPLSRALDALRNIYDHGTVVGRQIKRETSNAGTGSGARTPLGPAQLASLAANGVMVQDPRSVPGHLDPHQNAALAMTELQQQSGGSVADFSAGYSPFHSQRCNSCLISPSIPFTQLPATSGAQPLLDIAGYDPASYMSPMDLYDSIFWGK